MTIERLTVISLFIIISAETKAQEVNKKPLDFHVGFGIAYGEDDYLGKGYTSYIGIEKSLYKKHYAVIRFRNISAAKNFYFSGNDRGYSVYSYSNAFDLEYNYRATLHRIEFIPTLGFSLRHSIEKLHGARSISTDPDGIQSLEFMDFKEFTGFTIGYTFGMNINLLLNKHTAIGARYTLQGFTKSHYYNMVSFQIRNNFWKLDKVK